MADEPVPPPRTPTTQIPVRGLPTETKQAWAAFGVLALAGLGASLVRSGGRLGQAGGFLFFICALGVLAGYQYGAVGDESRVPVFLRRSKLPIGFFAYGIALLYLGGEHPHPLELAAAGPWTAALATAAVPVVSFAGIVGVAARRRWSRRWFVLGWVLAASVLIESWGLGLFWASL